MKNRNDEKNNYWKVVFSISLILIVVVPIALVVLFYYLDVSILKEDIDFITSLNNHLNEIIVLSFSIIAIGTYFVAQQLVFSKPHKTTTLARQKWQPVDKQKEYFAVAPIDTNKQLKVGGAPVNKLSATEILYEKDSVHDLCVGSTRSGKSRKIVRQLVMLCSMAGESMLFNDPKKEMYQDFKIYLESKGYDVYCLDFRNAQYSNGWNPMEDIRYMFELGNVDDADQYASDQVTSLVVDNGTSEPIWIDGQKALIKSCMLEVAQAPISKDRKNYYSVVQMISVLGKEEAIDGQKKMLLSAYMDSLNEMSPSRVSYTPIATSPEKTRGSFMTSALATLSPFTGVKIMKALSSSEFNFHDFTNGKKALFVVNPDEKKTYNAVSAMVYDSAYQALIFEANRLPGRKLKKRVHMIYDEFGNMPKIDALETKITVALSRDVIYHLYLQDFKQMNEIYGDNVASIIRGNCNLKYFISSGDYATCEEMSQLFGEETTWVDSRGGNYNQNINTTGGTVTYNQQTTRLADANMLMSEDTTDGHDIKVYRTYLGAMKVELPDCSQYSWYKEMKHDETEVVNENLKLDYAIPRYIIINKETFRKYTGINGFNMIDAEISEVLDRRMSARTKATLKSDEMYWYWSKRNDLQETVTRKVIDKIVELNVAINEFDVKKYMSSKEFIMWLTSIDVEDAEENHNSEDSEFNMLEDWLN